MSATGSNRVADICGLGFASQSVPYQAITLQSLKESAQQNLRSFSILCRSYYVQNERPKPSLFSKGNQDY